jgi:hypothetical protein
VVVADDLAVRVITPVADRQTLVDLYRRVQPRGRQEPPSVDVPEGMHLLGTMDADAAVASRAFAVAGSDFVPGTGTARSIGWVGATEAAGTLALVALPGSAADLDAIAVGEVVLRWDAPLVTRGEVDGRDYLVLEDRPAERWGTRAIWMEAPWGDLLTVRAHGRELPSTEQLLDLLRGVQPADDTAWEELLIDATGGSGLEADADRTELARGEVGDLGWLLQTAPPTTPCSPQTTVPRFRPRVSTSASSCPIARAPVGRSRPVRDTTGSPTRSKTTAASRS